ncbi:hypothetical protein LX32DRAFT_634889 [Colletotrichum zoysiae]|uniref:Uncharacterized protein n=1 Tax=Colletotrichum zoysiae TaxID=1216348 RepID=A0AAD9HTA3_9PEZI|nr:hypothetical protein LX32DRAFT_634889 [Colletotrichum zoysiae]
MHGLGGKTDGRNGNRNSYRVQLDRRQVRLAVDDDAGAGEVGSEKKVWTSAAVYLILGKRWARCQIHLHHGSSRGGLEVSPTGHVCPSPFRGVSGVGFGVVEEEEEEEGGVGFVGDPGNEYRYASTVPTGARFVSASRAGKFDWNAVHDVAGGRG